MTIKALVEPIRIQKAILGFSGWPDAGMVVQFTLEELKHRLHGVPAARWDLDGFWHTEALRPEIDARHGQIRRLDWPAYDFSLSKHPSTELVLLGYGPEPTLRWREFTRQLLAQLQAWDCQELILLGSLYDSILYDEVVVSSVVQSTRMFNMARELGCRPIEYQGPTAVHAALMEASLLFGMDCLSLWTHFPSYLSGPHELIMARLLGMTARLLNTDFDTRTLVERWQVRAGEIENLIEQDPDLRQMLESIKNEEPPPARPRSSPKVVRMEEFMKRRHEPKPDDKP